MDFVPSNIYSLAQAYVTVVNEPIPPMLYSVYNDDTMIGFIKFYYDLSGEYDSDPCYVICRFMIDRKYQNQGFGKQAMTKVLNYIKTFPKGKAEAVYLSYDPRNKIAIKLYHSMGFAETGAIVREGEVVTKLLL